MDYSRLIVSASYFCFVVSSNAPSLYGSQVLEDLTHNVYNIKNTKYAHNLQAPIQPVDLIEGEYPFEKSNSPENKFNQAIRFIPSLDENGTQIYYLQVLGKGANTYLQYDTSLVFNNKTLKVDKENDKSFKWEVKPVARKGLPIIEITHFLTKKSLGVSTDNKKLHCILVESDVPNVARYWRLHAFYPAEGYSDFYRIIRDYGNLISRLYTKDSKDLRDNSIKTMKADPHDPYFLTIQPASKTILNLSDNDNECAVYHREIFSIRDKSFTLKESTFKLSRLVELESSFETSIQNSVTMNDSHQTATGQNSSNKALSSKSNENETSDQRSYMQSLSTTISANINFSTENSKEKSQTDSSQTTEGKSDSTSTSVGGSITTSVSAETGYNVGIVSGSVSASVSGTVTAGLDTNSSSHTDKTTGVQKSDTERTSERKEENKGTQDTTTSDKQSSDTKRQTEAVNTTQERADDTSQNSSVTVEKVVNVTNFQLKRETEKQNWLIEREIVQPPFSLLEVKIFEQAVEVSNYPYVIDLKVSGHIGFKFENTHIPSPSYLPHNEYNDFIEGSTWYISPATIVQTLPAPGYHPNEDGSITYKSHGTLNLKKPVNLYADIHQLEYEMEEKQKQMIRVL